MTSVTTNPSTAYDANAAAMVGHDRLVTTKRIAVRPNRPTRASVTTTARAIRPSLRMLAQTRPREGQTGYAASSPASASLTRALSRVPSAVCSTEITSPLSCTRLSRSPRS